VKVERIAVDPGVAVGIFERANLGPGKIDPQRDQNQQQVHDPDTKVFAASRREFDRMAMRDARAGCIGFQIHYRSILSMMGLDSALPRSPRIKALQR
jgi:hypothetical protein